jgi:hypothetical protein
MIKPLDAEHEKQQNPCSEVFNAGKRGKARVYDYADCKNAPFDDGIYTEGKKPDTEAGRLKKKNDAFRRFYRKGVVGPCHPERPFSGIHRDSDSRDNSNNKHDRYYCQTDNGDDSVKFPI